MTIAPGRKGTTTARDQQIFEVLFFCRYLSTKQLTALFFGSGSRARTRLGQLKDKGYLDRRSMYVRAPTSWQDRGTIETVWYLTKPAFDSVAATHDYKESYTPKQLLDETVRHYVLANEVFVLARPYLDAELGPYPKWEWRHERRAFYQAEYANVPYQHKPDAHILFREHTFILERQTAESRPGPKKIYKKVEDHARYVQIKLRSAAEVLFAFDTDDTRLIEEAERAGELYGIRVVAGDVWDVAHYLYNSAVRLY